MTFFSNFGYNKIFPLKCKTVTLNHFCSFRNIHWSALKKRWRMLILGLKVTHFPHLGHNNSHFYPLFNGCHHVQFQKNLINRFWQNFKNINLGPVIGPFTIYIYIHIISRYPSLVFFDSHQSNSNHYRGRQSGFSITVILKW